MAPRLDPKLAADAAAWISNVVSSVAIIFVNKVLMGRAGFEFVYGERWCLCMWGGVKRRAGCGGEGGSGTFPPLLDPCRSLEHAHPPPSPATTLCALHYVACAASTTAINASRAASASAASSSSDARTPRTLPRRDLAIFTATANASIVSLNLSLMLNKVGFYQVAKLLIIPFVCGVERVWLGRRFTPSVAAAVGIVVIGVAIVTVSDVTSVGGASALGASVAAVSVVSSGMQQILCRVLQQAHGLTAHELLSVTAPAQV